MSSMVVSWRRTVCSPGSPFSLTERAVAQGLSMYMSEAGDSCFPSIPTLAADVGCAESTCRDALNRLAEWGFLDRHLRRGRGRSNEYFARIPRWFDREATVEENHRQAVVFASGHEQLVAGPVVEPVPETESDPDQKTTGTRGFFGSENHRLADLKPPADARKTTGSRRQLVQEGSKENSPLPPADAAGVDREGSLRYQLELALTAELGFEPVTREAKRDWAETVAQLAEAGATAAAIGERCAAYRAKWPTAALTPLALRRHWDLLGGHVDVQRPGMSVDRWVEQTGWRMTDDVAREVLFSKQLQPDEIDRQLQRCQELRAEHAHAGGVTQELLDEARRVA